MNELSVSLFYLRGKKVRRGFTVVELLLVVAMLGIVALLLMSYTGDVGNVSVDAASWKIQSDIRHAQQLASTTGQQHGVKFNEHGTYVVYNQDPSMPVSDPLDKRPMVGDVGQFGSIWVGNAYQVEFDKEGHPSMGGGGYVEILAENGASRRIFVIKDTGAVVVDVLGYGSGCGCRTCQTAE